jgi:hypothetical protein
MGGSESKPDLSEQGGLTFPCCTQGRSDEDFGKNRKGILEQRTSGSFKKSQRRSGSFKNSDEVENVNAAGSSRSPPRQSNSSSNIWIDMKSWQKSGSWNSKIGKESQGSRNWNSGEQRALENAVEMAAARLKIKPPGFFAIQVKSSTRD